MLENGATPNEAAMQAGIHRATVFSIKLKFLQTGSEKNRSKPGRPRSTTTVQDRFQRLTALRRWFKSSVKLNANLGRATGFAVGEGISGAASFGQTNRISMISTTSVNMYGGESVSVMFL